MDHIISQFCIPKQKNMVVTEEIKNHVAYSISNICLTSNVIYEAAVTKSTEDEKRLYFSASDTTKSNNATIHGILIMSITL